MNKLTKNGGTSLLLDDEFTFSFFFAGSNLDPSKIYRCYFHKKSITFIDKQFFSQPMVGLEFLSKENGKFDLNTLMVSERCLVIAR